ncbi:MAG TPA: hydroxyacid-oxoacid transhydrogenase, partial [Chloroflexota bacterium]|nr:hydroxyacid-oxoacid transhydrogenase [Chloroflexota bacterium]
MANEAIFTMDASSIKYGPGATREVGSDMRALGANRVMVVTDPGVARLEPVAQAMESLHHAGIDAVLYDQVRVEPTDGSFQQAIAFATEGSFDGYVAVGGGSSMDTAKAANLYATYPTDFRAYVNAPVGRGEPVPGRLRPLIAIPTTSGTGSETTGVAIFDLVELHAKTGIAHRALRPTMGIVDPNNTRDLPSMVAACSGFDVLSHAIESYTALPYHEREAPAEPRLRPAYQGSNPISDIWAERTVRMVAHNFVRAVKDPSDYEARAQMMLAATFAGIGFGNAGVHLPHGMSYPVSGMVREYVPPGYPREHAIAPHGMSVILNAPSVFRWTASANPQRHLQAAEWLGGEVRGAGPENAGDVLSSTLIELMRKTDMPNGLRAIGFSEDDVDELVKGTLPQHRVTKLAPRPVMPDDLRELFLS